MYFTSSEYTGGETSLAIKVRAGERRKLKQSRDWVEDLTALGIRTDHDRFINIYIGHPKLKTVGSQDRLNKSFKLR